MVSELYPFQESNYIHLFGVSFISALPDHIFHAYIFCVVGWEDDDANLKLIYKRIIL